MREGLLQAKTPADRQMTCARCGQPIPAERGDKALYDTIRCRNAALKARYRAKKREEMK